MPLSQICRRIELYLREIIPRFEMNVKNLLFLQLNSYSYFKASTETSAWGFRLESRCDQLHYLPFCNIICIAAGF
jgi:hypothetical protein